MNKEELEKLAEKGDPDAKQNLAESLTIRDRLLRRLEKNTVLVPFNDDLGEFMVEVKLLNPKELDAVGKMYAKLLGYRTKTQRLTKTDQPEQDNLIKEGEAIMDELYGWVEHVCVDSSLTLDYWKQGTSFTIDVPLALLRVAMAESQKTATDIRSFRKHEPRTRTIPVSDGNK